MNNNENGIIPRLLREGDEREGSEMDYDFEGGQNEAMQNVWIGGNRNVQEPVQGNILI